MDPLFVGLDVAKDHLDVYTRPSGEAFVVAHDEAGLTELVARLPAMAPTLIVLEATGGYDATVAAPLAAAGMPVAVVNPRQIRDFARATGTLAKPDALDAQVIARFAEAVRPVARPLPAEHAQRLGELVTRRRQRRQLVEMLGAESYRRRLVRTRALPRRLDAHLAWLERARRELERTCTTRSARAPPGATPRMCSHPSPASVRSRP
jgi:transposase